MSTLAAPLGIVRGMRNEDYHARTEAISSTGIRRLARSPLHFFGCTLDPRRPAPPGNEAMRAGTLAHCALLEPHALAERYAVKPPGLDGRTREGRAWAEANATREHVTTEQMHAAQHQARMVRALPEIGPLLEHGEPEVSAFWIDPATGVYCKCRPDWVTPSGDDAVVLLDLKTTQDASTRGFSRSIWNYRYDLQAAWYVDGYERASGKMVHGLVFIAVESEWPHAAAAYMLDDRAMAQARAENHLLRQLYAECRRADAWPGYAATIQPIALPRWAA